MTLDVRGVSYMVDEVPTEAAISDLNVIRHRLHCTAVILIGMSLERMIAAATHALAQGLDVWLEPHPVNMRHSKVLANLIRFATAAEALRREHPERVKLIVGCEFSVHLNAGLPGRFEFVRFWTLKFRPWFQKRIDRKVNKLVQRLVVGARQLFSGQITYAAAAWENIDWSCCDYVGINLYRTANNSATFVQRVHSEVTRTGKPLVITEFGCGSHIGAAQRGPGSFKIVQWFGRYPRIKSGHVRSERVQAAYLGSLIDLWDALSVYACFVYTFALREYPHNADPRLDLDMASFGLVKFTASDVTTWEPKLGFHAVEERYRRIQQRVEVEDVCRSDFPSFYYSAQYGSLIQVTDEGVHGLSDATTPVGGGDAGSPGRGSVGSGSAGTAAPPPRSRSRAFATSPVLLILVLAPYFGEGLSGSSPPLDLIVPWHFAFMCALYGSGALLCREVAHRLGLGMTGLILLGCAYGVFEEGIVDRYFFYTRYWEESGVDRYSVLGHTNVLLTVHLTAFHAAVSITLSVLVVEWLRPSSRHRPWVQRRGLIVAGVALASTPLLYGEFQQRPPLFTLVRTFLIMLAVIGLAIVLGRRTGRRTRGPRVSRRGVSLVCFLCALSHWLVVYTVPSTNIVWPVGVALAILPVAVGLFLIPRMAVGGPHDRDAMRAGSGVILFFVGLDVVAGVIGFRIDLICSALLTAVGLGLLRRRAPELLRSKPPRSGVRKSTTLSSDASRRGLSH